MLDIERFACLCYATRVVATWSTAAHHSSTNLARTQPPHPEPCTQFNWQIGHKCKCEHPYTDEREMQVQHVLALQQVSSASSHPTCHPCKSALCSQPIHAAEQSQISCLQRKLAQANLKHWESHAAKGKDNVNFLLAENARLKVSKPDHVP